MGNQRISRVNKEKFAMIASSVLIVTACALTGVYINGREKAKIVDFSALEDEDEVSLDDAEDEGAQVQQSVVVTNDGLAALDQDLDVDPAYQETGSSSVVNPPVNEDGALGDTQKRQDDEESKDEDAADDENGEAAGDTDAEENDGSEEGKSDTQETMSAQGFSFTEGEKLAWPVEGDVLLNYSMDQTTYFATLEQYKYNPALIIQGTVGDAVKAPVSATVKEVGENAEIGSYVTFDMGNGYELTVGQLDALTVKTGDIVKKEQTIGKVAEPSKYYSVEGSNIYLKLTKDGESVNPMNYLS